MLVSVLFWIIAIQEVGIVGMCLELADVAIVAIHATLVRQRGTAALSALGGIGIAIGIQQVGIGILAVIVTTCPLAKHTSVISSLLHHLGDNLMAHEIRFLTNESIVGIVSESILFQCTSPILSITTHMCMASMLTSHERSTRRCTHRTASISLSEAHAFLCHTVKIGSLYQLLTIASEVAISHIIAHDEDDIGAILLHCIITCRWHQIVCHSHSWHHT